MSFPDLHIHRVSGEDWRSHRDLRLEMLADAPHAFWATLDQVRERTEEQWRGELAGSRIFLQARSTPGDDHSAAGHGAAVLGQLGIDPVGYTEELALPSDTVNIVSLYVRPAHRGGGVTRALFAAAAETMRSLGRSHMLLETPDDNMPARRRYRALGFRETGRTAPDPRREGHVEVEYAAHVDDLMLD